ncbi:MAG: hypothetical protein V2A34_11630 [Lentisphaerota bacterium]
MSFLSNLFKRKAEPAAPAAKPKPQPSVVSRKQPIVTVRPAAPKPQEMKIEDIVSALRQIQEVVGSTDDGSADATTTSKLASIELKLKDIIGILPAAFDASATASLSDDNKTEILVDDLYEQLARGRIETSTKHFLAGVPKQYLNPGFEMQGKQMINLPLPLVVNVINPTEFKKRTSAVERDMGIRDVPDVFAGANRQKPLSAALPPPKEPGAPATKTAPGIKPLEPVTKPAEPVAKPVAKPAEPAKPVAKSAEPLKPAVKQAEE